MNAMRIFSTVVFSFWAAVAAAQIGSNDFTLPHPMTFDEPLANASTSISAGALAAHIGFLASPSLEGRALATPGYDVAAEYVVSSLKLAGIAPFGSAEDGQPATWFQAVPVRQLMKSKGIVEISRREGATTISRQFLCSVDCVIRQAFPGSVEAPVVFAGYGIREGGALRDDYATLDVRGRIVMILAGVPPDLDWQRPEMLRKYASKGRERDDAKLEIARGLGASALLVVEDADFGTTVATLEKREARPFASYAAAPSATPLIRVSQAVARSILGDTSFERALEGKRAAASAIASIRVQADEKLNVSRNVFGIIRGSDPVLRDQAVVVGAHLDHLGKINGIVHPGADDNASGVATLIEIARAFASAEQKPRRTIVFAFWSGEEEGHFGSRHYVLNPRWPLVRTAAYLNLDMIGHPWLADEIRKLVVDSGIAEGDSYLAKVKPEWFVEPGIPREAPALEAALRKSASGNGLAMHIDRTDGKQGGSDYRAFAREGVPFIRFFGNYFPGYHTPDDTREKLDPAQVERVGRFAFATAWILANE